MRRLLLILFTIMAACMASAQDTNVKARINTLKQDAAYLWGEMQSATLADAINSARADLLLSLNELCRNRDLAQCETLPEVESMLILTYQRGARHVAFVCARIDELLAACTPVAAKPKEPKSRPSEADLFRGNDDILAHVCAPEMVTDVLRYLSRIKGEGRISALDKTADYTTISADAYVVGFDKDRVVRCVLTPVVNGQRYDAKNNRQAPSTFSGLGFIWYR